MKVKMVKLKLKDWLDVAKKLKECMSANKALNKQIKAYNKKYGGIHE